MKRLQALNDHLIFTDWLLPICALDHVVCARSVLCTFTSLTVVSWPQSMHIIQLQIVNIWLTFTIPRYDDLTNVSVFLVFLYCFPPHLLHVDFFFFCHLHDHMWQWSVGRNMSCQIFQCWIILARIALDYYYSTIICYLSS